MLSAGSFLQKIGFNQLFESAIPTRHGLYRGSLLNAARSLQILGIDFAYMHTEEPCCGVALHTYGLIDEFSKHASKVYEFLKKRGTTRLITHNPICGAAFKKLYPQYIPSWDIEVKHVSEVIAEKIVKEDLHFAHAKIRVTYHDPCFLARHMDVIQEPRTILSRIDGVELVEPDHTKRETWCDGGGGVEVLYPHLCDKIAETRVKELAATGAGKILSSCPVCAMMIRRGIHITGARIEYADIVDLFFETARDSRPTLGIKVQ
jgi:Fe-S oxidoreductase